MGGGLKKKASSRRDLTDEELGVALSEIADGSDRVAAIMGCALVENTLVGALITCLEDASDAAKLFDDERGPFKSFYAQIVAAKAMGLFDAKIASALHAVRQIRNEFAHAILSLEFETESIAKMCIKLKSFENKDAHHEKVSPPRRYFEHACYELTCELIRVGTRKFEKDITIMKQRIALEEYQSRSNALSGLSHFLNTIPASLKGRD
ncbi:hypothetical protein [Sphingomonas sp.]|uniref:DUF4145 domain-containing protein n=1 Tax=Sphingomonas sp. TaxID=28214 RepID=UPI0025E31AC7|nr:hypothetical protein [Sphingomonas sp.]